MDFRTIVAAIRRGWWILLIATFAGFHVAMLVSSQTAPEYTATARLFISATGGNSSSEAFSGGQFAEQRAESYAHIITSRQITQRVVDELDLGMSAQELATKVNAAIVPRTVLMDVSATDPSRERAAAIANSLADAFIGYVQPLEIPAGQSTPRSTITVVNRADTPLLPTSPDVGRNAVYGCIGGLAAGLLAIALVRVLTRRISSLDEVGRLSGAPAIGPISTPVRGSTSGDDRLFDWTPEEAEQLRRLRVQIEARDPAPQILLVAPASPGGAAAALGAGLAAAFAEKGNMTALVTIDHQGVPGPGMATSPIGLAELIEGRASFEEVLHSTVRENLYVVRTGSTADAEALVSSPAMGAFVDDLRKECDRAVIVTPAVFDSSAASVLSAIVDADLLVVQSRKTHRRQLAWALDELKAARAFLLAVVLAKEEK